MPNSSIVKIIFCITIETLDGKSNLEFFANEDNADKFAIIALNKGCKVTKSHYELH